MAVNLRKIDMSNGASGGPIVATYLSSDPLSVTMADNYFNGSSLKTGDGLYIIGSDGLSQMCTVTLNSGSVTLKPSTDGVKTLTTSAGIVVGGSYRVVNLAANYRSVAEFSHSGNLSVTFNTGSTGSNALRTINVDHMTQTLSFARMSTVFDSGAQPVVDLCVDSAGNVGIGTKAPNSALDVVGNVTPHADNSYSLGTGTYRYSTVYAATGTINTSDVRHKIDIVDSILGLDFIMALRPVSYRYKVGGYNNERICIDGEYRDVQKPIPGKRQHYGLIAQEVKDALPKNVDFAGWVLTDCNDPDSQQGLRYDQFIAPLIKAAQQLANDVRYLQSKVASLETLLLQRG